MTRASDRRSVIPLISEAVDAGARLSKACHEVGITARTYQRWRKLGENGGEDQRPQAIRPSPAHKLSDEERRKVVAYANSYEFRSLPPSQIVPKLADRGIFVASESTFYRILKEAKLNKHRGDRKEPERRDPPSHVATAPNQV